MVELGVDPALVVGVFDVAELEEGSDDPPEISEALPVEVVGPLKNRRMSLTRTVPRLRLPAMRSRSSQLAAMCSVLIRWRAIELRGP